VCTHPDHQGHGLMRVVMTSALAQCDREFETTALFTIEPSLYRRFGFRVVPQTVYELREPLPRRRDRECRRLDAARADDVALVRNRLAHRAILSRRLAMGREAIDLFLLNEVTETGGFGRLFYLPAFDTIVAAEWMESTLVIHDLIAPELPPFFDVLAALPRAHERVEVHFCPDRLPGLRFAPLPLVTDEYLMLRGPLGLDEGELIVPQHIRC
jgi:Acetyltransferase (GNAT) domain